MNANYKAQDLKIVWNHYHKILTYLVFYGFKFLKHSSNDYLHVGSTYTGTFHRRRLRTAMTACMDPDSRALQIWDTYATEEMTDV